VSIFLIRHGQTELNRTRVVQPPETPLGAAGVAQAERRAAQLADMGVARIVSSDLARAHMTATVIAAGAGLDVELDPDLQERNFGDVRGTPYTELESRRIDIFAPDYAPPGGETWDVFHARVARAWKRAGDAALGLGPERHLAVVTHGLVCHSILTRGVDDPPSRDDWRVRALVREVHARARCGRAELVVIPMLGRFYNIAFLAEHRLERLLDAGLPTVDVRAVPRPGWIEQGPADSFIVTKSGANVELEGDLVEDGPNAQARDWARRMREQPPPTFRPVAAHALPDGSRAQLWQRRARGCGR